MCRGNVPVRINNSHSASDALIDSEHDPVMINKLKVCEGLSVTWSSSSSSSSSSPCVRVSRLFSHSALYQDHITHEH